MCEKEDEDRIINSNDFYLTEEMNKKIVSFLRLKNNDIMAMYAAKLIEFYQKQDVLVRKDCLWKHYKEDRWETTCKNFVSNTNFIHHGGMEYCCFCGNKLSVTPMEEGGRGK